jgi:ribose transport system substrate-binding protein
MKTKYLLGIFLPALAILVGGCGRSKEPGSPSSKGTFYWVQPLKGHPVHQMTQIAFLEGCRKLGYEGVVVGTDGADIAGTIALAEQVLARGNAKGMAIWTGNPAFNPLIERAGKAGVPVILPHFPIAEGTVPGATGIIGCDPAAFARSAAEEIGKAIGGKGTVAITQGSFNTTENLVAETFTSYLHEHYPEVKVLKPEEEGFDSSKSVAKAISILQAHADLVAAISTTGGGPTTWAGAQRGAGRRIVAIGMDYTRINLDLVASGEIYAVIGQPLWEESFGAAELLDRAARGEKIPWWTQLPAPIIKKDNIATYAQLLDKVEAALKR